MLCASWRIFQSSRWKASCLCSACGFDTRRFVRHVSWPMLGGMATALLDETIQLYVPGRTSSVRDVWIDFGGVIAGLFVALLLLLIVRG